MTRDAWRCTRLLPDDVIRLRDDWEVPSKAKFVDGARVGDLRHEGVRFLLARDHIYIERDGKRLRPTPTKKMRREAAKRCARPVKTGPIDPWAPRMRRCIVCDVSFLAENIGDRICPRCLAERDASED